MIWLRNNTSAKAGVRRLDRPAPTMYFGARSNTAAFVERPTDAPKEGRRLQVHEAGVFQGFPASYPWRGTGSQQYQQVGNAVPVPLAEACIREALGL